MPASVKIAPVAGASMLAWCWSARTAGADPDSEPRFLNSRNHILTACEPAWPVFLAEVDRFLAASR
jgi:hypothetical protein